MHGAEINETIGQLVFMKSPIALGEQIPNQALFPWPDKPQLPNKTKQLSPSVSPG
jgi:hypothetical protein